MALGPLQIAKSRSPAQYGSRIMSNGLTTFNFEPFKIVIRTLERWTTRTFWTLQEFLDNSGQYPDNSGQYNEPPTSCVPEPSDFEALGFTSFQESLQASSGQLSFDVFSLHHFLRTTSGQLLCRNLSPWLFRGHHSFLATIALPSATVRVVGAICSPSIAKTPPNVPTPGRVCKNKEDM